MAHGIAPLARLRGRDSTCYTGTMVRRTVYFLLVVMALQLSWSVVASYCLHETGRTANHLGHHAHNTSEDELSLVVKGHQSVAKKVAMHDAHCASVAHLALAASDASIPLHVVGYRTRALAVPLVTPATVFLSPPDRPQWTGRA